MAKTFRDFVDDAKTRIREVGIDEVKSQADEATLVDLREDSEWDKGHLPGALHLSRGVLEVRADKVLPDKDAPRLHDRLGGSAGSIRGEHLEQRDLDDAVVARVDARRLEVHEHQRPREHQPAVVHSFSVGSPAAVHARHPPAMERTLV